MIRDNVRGALGNGFDVILEGILSTRGYRDVFATLFREHPRNNYLFERLIDESSTLDDTVTLIRTVFA